MHAFVYGAVAIVVNAVANFGGSRIDGGVAAVAIATAQKPRVAVARAGRGALRHTSAGVVVIVVGIQIPDRVGIQIVVGIVAVGVVGDVAGGCAIAGALANGRIAESVTVAVLIISNKGDAVVSRAVAVIVYAVAHLRRAGFDGGVAVVAIAAAQQSRVAVACAGRGALCHTGSGVVIIVVGIQVPDGIGVDGVVGIVAVGVVDHITCRQGAGHGGIGRIAETVAIAVAVVSRLHTFVYGAVAIVVYAVANFGRSRIDGGVAVVAIATCRKSRVAVACAGRSALCHTRAGVISIPIGIQIPNRIGIQIVVGIVAIGIIRYKTNPASFVKRHTAVGVAKSICISICVANHAVDHREHDIIVVGAAHVGDSGAQCAAKEVGNVSTLSQAVESSNNLICAIIGHDGKSIACSWRERTAGESQTGAVEVNHAHNAKLLVLCIGRKAVNVNIEFGACTESGFLRVYGTYICTGGMWPDAIVGAFQGNASGG